MYFWILIHSMYIVCVFVCNIRQLHIVFMTVAIDNEHQIRKVTVYHQVIH